MEYFFAYGTLKYGYKHPMANFLNHYSKFLGRGYFQGKLYMVSHYPGAVLSENPDDMVFGHVFQLNYGENLLFKTLDAYEGINTNGVDNDPYRRIKVKVHMDALGSFDAWVYIYNFPTENLLCIPSGNFIIKNV